MTPPLPLPLALFQKNIHIWGDRRPLLTNIPHLRPEGPRDTRGAQNAHKNEKKLFFKMPPKIVVTLVLWTSEHLELGLILQNWLFARPAKFENLHYGVKIQNCCRPMVWPLKTCARRALSQQKKLELNRTYQLREKSEKPPERTGFLEGPTDT